MSLYGRVRSLLLTWPTGSVTVVSLLSVEPVGAAVGLSVLIKQVDVVPLLSSAHIKVIVHIIVFIHNIGSFRNAAGLKRKGNQTLFDEPVFFFLIKMFIFFFILLSVVSVIYQEFADLSQFTEEAGRQDHDEQTGGGGRKFILEEKEQKSFSQTPHYILNVWVHSKTQEDVSGLFMKQLDSS